MSVRENRDQFRDYLRRRLLERGITARALSLHLKRDEGYITQLLSQRSSRPRALPTPAELRLAAPLLDVPFAELLEQAWGINLSDLLEGLDNSAAMLQHKLDGWDRLTAAQREDVQDYVWYVLEKRHLHARHTTAEQMDGTGECRNRI